MNLKRLPLVLALGAIVSTSTSVMAETPKLEFPAPSPSATLKQRVGLTDITVEYSRPSLKNRTMFGDFVPYGKVWRTGANQATKVIFSTPVKLNGTEVPAGTYALVTIPGADEWTVIINKGAEQWGAYKYDEKADVARIKVKPVAMANPLETFTIEFNDLRDTSGTLNLAWDKTVVPVKVEVEYVDKLLADIKAEMASDDAKKPYFQAAAFYYNNNQDLNDALKWVDAAQADKKMFYMMFLKAQILQKKGDKAAALAAAKEASELSEKNGDVAYIRKSADLVKELQ